MIWQTRDIERLVRFFLGLPTATGYFYARHFSTGTAYGLLTVGLLLLVAGLSLGHKETLAASTPSIPLDDTALLVYGF